ncbi:MAG: LysR substrate-binding domain-containing protein, partial [Xanthomonadales bacterium]|nr:LysR substrate-binding domain-containing protein [Xanthomonadales bacterium]
MNRDLPSFPAVRAFEAAARRLSFKEAADELHVTQSAISHQIKSLEAFLGIALFRRTSRGVALTPDGASYLVRVSEVLDHLASATYDIRDRHVAGTLYVRSTPAFASRWLVPRLNDFNRWYPDIELHVSTSLEPANFVHDGVDVDIRFGIVASSDLHAEPLLESSRFPVASPGLIAGGPPLRRPHDLRGYILLHNEVEDGWTQWFARAGVEHVEPDPGPRF